MQAPNIGITRHEGLDKHKANVCGPVFMVGRVMVGRVYGP